MHVFETRAVLSTLQTNECIGVIWEPWQDIPVGCWKAACLLTLMWIVASIDYNPEQCPYAIGII